MSTFTVDQVNFMKSFIVDTNKSIVEIQEKMKKFEAIFEQATMIIETPSIIDSQKEKEEDSHQRVLDLVNKDRISHPQVFETFAIVNQRINEDLQKLHSTIDQYVVSSNKWHKEYKVSKQLIGQLMGVNVAAKDMKHFTMIENNSIKERFDNLMKDYFEFSSEAATMLNNLLKTHKSVIAGGSALYCLTGFNNNTSFDGDMDIFIPSRTICRGGMGLADHKKQVQDFDTFLTSNGYKKQRNGEELIVDSNIFSSAPWECDVQDERVKKIYGSLDKIVSIQTYTNQNHSSVQLICIEFDHVKPFIRTFDLSACQTYYDGENVFTRTIYSQLTLNFINTLLKKTDLETDTKYVNRIFKYFSRGFVPYIHQDKMSLEDKKTFDNLFGAFLPPGYNYNKESTKTEQVYYVPIDKLVSMKQKYTIKLEGNSWHDTSLIAYNNKQEITLCNFTQGNVENVHISKIQYIVNQYNKIIVIDFPEMQFQDKILYVKDPLTLLIPIQKFLSFLCNPMRCFVINHAYFEQMFQDYYKFLELCKEALSVFESTDTEKLKISNIFKKDFQALLEQYYNRCYTQLLGTPPDMDKEFKNRYKKLTDNFISYVVTKIHDCRWLILFMTKAEYNYIFKFTQDHYILALENSIARDNLYCIKNLIKKESNQEN